MRMMSCKNKCSAGITITSDASGSWGCGAFACSGEWFQLYWPALWSGVHITVKELVPIVIACAVWGKNWQGKTVRFRCDNAAVVAIINSGRSKEPTVIHLMRCLSFFLAHFNVFIFSEHLPGKQNEAADSLSRDKVGSFFVQVPGAHKEARTSSHSPTTRLDLNKLLRSVKAAQSAF